MSGSTSQRWEWTAGAAGVDRPPLGSIADDPSPNIEDLVSAEPWGE